MFLNGERTFVPATPIFERVKSSIALKSEQTK
jgi:hypothetical protein